jgi:putative transposase
LAPVEYIEEVGGGLNFKRKKFSQLMDAVVHDEVKILVIAHKDRLCRFGFEWFERLCTQHGGIVLDNIPTRTEDHIMILSHKIALDLTVKQEQYFRRAAGTARFVWNWALAKWQALYEHGGKPTALQLKKLWNESKGKEYPWVYEVHKDVNQQPFSNLQKAFTRFFRGETGYPKFKKKGMHDSFYVSNDKLKVAGTRLSIPRLGWVKMREELRFTGKILGATVSREADRWFVSFQVDVGDKYTRERTGEGIVGVDLGVITLATLSTGEKFESPKPLKRLQERLKTAQRRVSRKLKGSHNRRQAVQRLARLHQRIKHTRHDVLHKLTSRLTNENQVVAIEDLHVKGMMANHSLAQAVSDIAFHEFRRQLAYKAERTDTHIVVVDRWFPSSKTCSQCGIYHEHLPLAQRTLYCVCGLEIDRDVNAAINLARVGYTRSDACEDISGGGTECPVLWSTSHVSLKQELRRVHFCTQCR